MKLTLAEPRYLKESISIISELVTEARFKVNKDAIELVAMDPANVAMVIFKLFSSSFVEYKVENPTEIAINLSNLKQILRRAEQSDMISLELEGKSKLKIVLSGSSKRKFYLPIIDTDENEQKVPELNFKVKVSMDSKQLSSAIDDADIVADSLSFIAEKNKLTIKAEGDLSQNETEILAGDNVIISYEGSEKIKSKYSVEYLKKMASASKLSGKCDLHFSEEYPLKLDFVEVDKVSLSFILAPRVEYD